MLLYSLVVLLYFLVGWWSELYHPAGSGVVVPPSTPLDTAAFPLGLVLLCPLPPLSILLFSPVQTGEQRYGPTGSGTVVPSPFLMGLLCYLVLTVEGRVWSYGVWYFCAPYLPLDTAVLSRFGS